MRTVKQILKTLREDWTNLWQQEETTEATTLGADLLQLLHKKRNIEIFMNGGGVQLLVQLINNVTKDDSFTSIRLQVLFALLVVVTLKSARARREFVDYKAEEMIHRKMKDIIGEDDTAEKSCYYRYLANLFRVNLIPTSHVHNHGLLRGSIFLTVLADPESDVRTRLTAADALKMLVMELPTIDIHSRAIRVLVGCLE